MYNSVSQILCTVKYQKVFFWDYKMSCWLVIELIQITNVAIFFGHHCISGCIIYYAIFWQLFLAALCITLYLGNNFWLHYISRFISGNYFWLRYVLRYIWAIIFGCVIYYAIFGQLFLAALYITLYLSNYFGCVIYYAIFG